ncbi:MAG TPA: 50S ribosomal protein L24 [Candidatus Omnitrophota bacterium]|nr:50S ribosomal protein L24 [Candidatus Omnitrophota bacterium]HPD83955.1 50S ribosomal protein L24 [Candidatus Omnitrophota bacterium]HRZ02812.1 50S ribosomal protein L24 [Candidatus Omnitrophota bacterium]
MLKIKKNDNVEVISGKDKGKKGRVLAIFPSENKALIENINLVKKAQRRTQQNQKGGIVSIESPIQMSKLMLVCKQCNKGVRFKTNVLKDKSKLRECKRCGAAV